MQNHYLAIFTQKNMAVLLLLGFASGLPLALTSGTLQAWMAVENVDLKTIGLFALVGQAYVFKFLWAPLMDRYVPPLFGRRRGWLVLTQLLLVVAIFVMGCLNPSQHLMWMATVAVFIAFFSASQDIVVDAYRTDLLTPEARGAGAAVSVLGYRIAMLVSSGLALWLAGRYLGWQYTYWLMAGLMLIGVLASLWATEPAATNAPKTLEQAVVIPFRDFLGRNNAWILLLLIIFYKMSDVFALSLSTAFLIRGVGFTLEQIAEIHKTLGLAATIVGVLLGGMLMQRMTLFRALLLFGVLQAASNFGYWILSVTDKHLLTMASVIVVENICSGMATAAFVALMMTLCNKSFSATQYALLSALSAIGRVYVGPLSGWFVESYGWSTFFLLSVAAAIPGLILLFVCRHTLESMQKTNEFTRRTEFSSQYRWAIYLLTAGGLLLISWVIFTVLVSLRLALPTQLSTLLLQSGALLCAIGITFGGILDYLAMRHERQLTVSK